MAIATPMNVLVYHDPLLSQLLGAIYFHYGVPPVTP